jgi:hypothetical protein
METLTIKCSDAQAEQIKNYIHMLNNNRSVVAGKPVCLHEGLEGLLSQLHQISLNTYVYAKEFDTDTAEEWRQVHRLVMQLCDTVGVRH